METQLDQSELTLQLLHPFCMAICGPSKAGKTELVKKIIQQKEECIYGKIRKVVYIAGQDQAGLFQFSQQVDNFVLTSEWSDSFLERDTIFIWDDYGSKFSKELNHFITGFVTKTVHHHNVSCILILHSLYQPGMRIASLSFDYVVLFNFPRDRSVISTLARQAFCGNSKFVKEAFDYVCQRPRGYLFCDFTFSQNPRYRLRSSIFNDPEMVVFGSV